MTLSYRREKLVRIKKKNEMAFAALLASGAVEPLFGSQVEEIRTASVLLRLADGSLRELANDWVFVFAGGDPPFELLKSAGVRFGG